ncbi:hypothetical protein BT67DRAFT_147326 [Trichocladium antarcticum]|uniref:Uncharacterized protein n=1 Tax=Trichocladium antarcticum TaxID=1450529 RepID=A0AAN6UEU9_9PEZI|nr:hypothetical protein BT67DRAFT_147326 [Trichocladium antarcticum]
MRQGISHGDVWESDTLSPDLPGRLQRQMGEDTKDWTAASRASRRPSTTRGLSSAVLLRSRLSVVFRFSLIEGITAVWFLGACTGEGLFRRTAWPSSLCCEEELAGYTNNPAVLQESTSFRHRPSPDEQTMWNTRRLKSRLRHLHQLPMLLSMCGPAVQGRGQEQLSRSCNRRGVVTRPKHIVDRTEGFVIWLKTCAYGPTAFRTPAQYGHGEPASGC